MHSPELKSNRYSSASGRIEGDLNQKTESRLNSSYLSRTLVQSNLCFDNDGSGIHSYRASRGDIINNTAYLDSASPALEYSQIFAARGDDVRILNNIMVAPIANLGVAKRRSR